MSVSHEVTGLLVKWATGNQQALVELTPLVYAELRRLAAAYLRRERPDYTLQPTALVHEAYLRLIDQRNLSWQNRSHFFLVNCYFKDRSKCRAGLDKRVDVFAVKTNHSSGCGS